MKTLKVGYSHGLVAAVDLKESFVAAVRRQKTEMSTGVLKSLKGGVDVVISGDGFSMAFTFM
ncbi:hypothetical protein [Pseudomonas sp. RA_35y_Pfl2_P32]|uniref:hypothetical protein n=1 Tax=Pseudomonas sp. RA_35y_Pfl2_P32 TaxID=3088705 RepID=UPI0030D75EE6